MKIYRIAQKEEVKYQDIMKQVHNADDDIRRIHYIKEVDDILTEGQKVHIANTLYSKYKGNFKRLK